jgi:large subunit ribosomal protein L37Ae
MGVKRKKIGAAGRFGAGYGKVREKLVEIESKQRKKQKCNFCENGNAKRQANGIWECSSCGKKFASGTYTVKPKN